MTRERAGRWLRVSTSDQEERNQERDVDGWIASHGYELADECTYQLRKSAYKGKHAAALDKVIEDMQDGKITVLVVWQSSRIERRGAWNAFDLARRVQQAGGRIEYSAPSDQYLNETNEMSDVRLAFAATKDHKESQEKSERVRIAQDAIRENNGLLGRIPYGFRPDGDKYSKRPVIYQREARVVREAVDRYLGGESLATICDDFNARGVAAPRRGRWIVSTLGRLLRNPSIAGRQMNNRDNPDAEKLTVLEYDGIITWREHEQLVARLDSRAHRKGISPSNVFMLTGLLVDEAGHPMYGKLNRHTFSYTCRKGCGFTVRVAQADTKVTKIVLNEYGHKEHRARRLIPGENYLDQIALLRQKSRELDPEGEDEQRAQYRAEIARLRSLPSRPDEVRWVPSGKTIAQHLQSLGTAGRRDWLRENGWKFTAVRDEEMPHGWRLVPDSGWTAGVSYEHQAESIGYSAIEDLNRRTADAAEIIQDAAKRTGVDLP